jgi:hypothetical protein
LGFGRGVHKRAKFPYEKGIKELSKFGFKPTAVRVEKLDTPLHDPRKARGGSKVIRKRQSLGYYWGGKRVSAAGHKQIRVLKAETDPDGKLWRRSVIYG